MKKLQIAPYTTAAIGFPVKEGTWDFLQMAYEEIIKSMLINSIGESVFDPTKVYVLHGLKVTSLMGAIAISPGAVFTNNEVYIYPGGLFAPSPFPNVLVGVLNVVQYAVNADPVKFTDSNFYNVHNDRQLRIMYGLSGAGNINGTLSALNDYNNFVEAIDFKIVTKNTLGTPEVVTFKQSKNIFYSPVVGGTPTITLDPTDGRVGAKVKLIMTNGALPSTVSFTSIGGQVIFTGSGSATFGAIFFFAVEIEYIGNLPGVSPLDLFKVNYLTT